MLTNGYTLGTHRGKQRLAHRIAYERVYGPIPDGKVIDHTCGQRACVNPEHLEPVSQAVNIRRGRGTKLTAAEAAAIRAQAPTVSYRELAERYGVSRGTIGDIRAGRTWKHVPV